MQVIAINAEKTVSPLEIAFNLDAQPPPGLIEKISYGNLEISFRDEVLIVKIPEDDWDTRFTAESVNTLNDCIKKAEAELQAIKKKKERMLAGLANEAGLPLV